MVFFEDSIKNLGQLRIQMVAGNEDIVGTGGWNLDLAAECAVLLIALVLRGGSCSTWQVWIAFRSVLYLVEAFFLAVEPLYLNHVEGVSE